MPLKGKSVVVTGSTSGIGLAIARAFAREGCNLTINGFGDKAAIEKERAGIEKEFGVKAIYSGADVTKPTEITDMIDTAEKTFGSGRRAGQQCRHPVRRKGRGLPDREVGRGDRDQSVRRVPRDARRNPRHEDAQVGPHHQHRLRARPRRERREGRLRGGEARHRRPDQGGGDRGRERRHHLQRDLPRLGADPAGAGSRSRRAPRRKARRSSRRRTSWSPRSSRCCKYTTPENIGALAVFLAGDAAETITGSSYSIDGGWIAQ